MPWLLATTQTTKEFCFPSVGRIAYKTGYKTRNTQAIIRRLTAKEILQPLRHKGGGRGLATVCKVAPEKGVRLAPFSKQRSPKAQRVPTCDAKGAGAVAPQSSGTTYESAPPISPLKGGRHERDSVESEDFMRWGGGYVAYFAEPKRRILTEKERQTMTGAGPERMAEFLRTKGFRARVVPPEEVALWQEPGSQRRPNDASNAGCTACSGTGASADRHKT